jgi:hypothetical protein
MLRRLDNVDLEGQTGGQWVRPETGDVRVAAGGSGQILR